jgi:hypothetical protein
MKWGSIIGPKNEFRANFIKMCADVHKAMSYDTISDVVDKYRKATDILRDSMSNLLESLAPNIAARVGLSEDIVKSVIPKLIDEYLYYYKNGAKELLNGGLEVNVDTRIPDEFRSFGNGFKKYLKEAITAAAGPAAAFAPAAFDLAAAATDPAGVPVDVPAAFDPADAAAAAAFVPAGDDVPAADVKLCSSECIPQITRRQKIDGLNGSRIADVSTTDIERTRSRCIPQISPNQS